MARLALFTRENGVLQALARPDWPAPSRGLLRLSAAQMDRITGAMADRSRRRIAGFLREAAPAETASLSDPQLLASVAASEASGKSLGLVGERALGEWAFLILTTNGAIERQAKVRVFLSAPDGGADRRMHRLLDEMVALEKADHRGVR